MSIPVDLALGLGYIIDKDKAQRRVGNWYGAREMKVKKADIALLLKATFPEYTGRKFYVQPQSSVRLDGLNWDGGSRSAYRAVTLDGKAIGNGAAFNAVAPWDNTAEGNSLDIPCGAVVARASVYCGIETGITFYINPADMPKLIGAQ